MPNDHSFETDLNALISEHLKRGTDREEIISALEIVKMTMDEESDDDE